MIKAEIEQRQKAINIGEIKCIKIKKKNTVYLILAQHHDITASLKICTVWSHLN